MTVTNIQDENARLRARLAALLTSKPGEEEAAPAAAPAEAAVPTSIDFAGLSRLQAELMAAKATLQDRELELGKASEAETDENTNANGGGSGSGADDARAAVLSSGTALAAVQAEVKTLHGLIAHLGRERDALARQRDTLTRELDARRMLKDAFGDVPEGDGQQSGRAAGVERALLDLRSVVDGVIKTWDQVSVAQPDHSGS